MKRLHTDVFTHWHLHRETQTDCNVITLKRTRCVMNNNHVPKNIEEKRKDAGASFDNSC